MVKGLPLVKASNKICTECFVGKKHRDAIPKRVNGELPINCSLYMLIFAGQLLPTPTATKGTS